MVDGRIETRSWSTRQLLLKRLQVVLAISLLGALVFIGLDLSHAAPALAATIYVKVAGILLGGAVLLGLRGVWAIRNAWWLSIGIVIVAYLMTAVSGMVSPSREYTTTAVLFAGAALSTGAIMPWGLWPQCATVAVGALALANAVFWADGSLGVLASDPGAAVLIALVVSVMTARETQRYRLAYRREMLVRRRAESAVKHLNAQLERRVNARTAALEVTNELLAEEVAQRRRTTNALRVSQAQLGDVIDHSTAMISLKDSRGRYLLVNWEFERCLGRSRANVIGRTDRDVFPAALADALRAGDEEVLAAGTSLSFEPDLSPAGEQRSYVCVKFPLHGTSTPVYGVGCMCTDITPLKQLEAEVRRHQDEQAQVLRLHSIRELAAGLAHEINQPLAKITAYVQDAAQRLRAEAADPAMLLEMCEQISREGLRAAQVIRALRSVVSDESRPSRALDVNVLAAEAARVLEPQARRHGVTVRVEGAAQMPPVQGYGTQIEQVMLNLMLNGVEAIADAASPRREVVVATAVSGNAVEVAVSDTGGIEPTTAGKLFTPFFTTKPRGLGLGLAISRSIVESHGGRLWASPTAREGSTFHFSLPIAPAGSARSRAAQR